MRGRDGKPVADLTAKLAPGDDRITKLIADRKAAHLKSPPDAAAGKATYRGR